LGKKEFSSLNNGRKSQLEITQLNRKEVEGEEKRSNPKANQRCWKGWK
jgi:hypothetical protein